MVSTDVLSPEEISSILEEANPTQTPMIENPKYSIPLYHKLTGPKGYRKSLSEASDSLYQLLHESPDVQSIVDQQLTVERYKLPPVPSLKKRPKPEHKLALEHLLHTIAHLLSQISRKDNAKKIYVAVPMGRGSYKKGERLEGISATAMRDMVSALFALKDPKSESSWIEFVPNYYDHKQDVGYQSRIRPLKPFADWLIWQELIIDPHPYGRKSDPKRLDDGGGLLRLKAEDARKEDPAEPLMRPLEGDELILPELNKRLARQKLKIALPSYEFFESHWSYTKHASSIRFGGDKFLYRQFKGEDGSGGRLYGHYIQGLPKSARKYLTIEGRETVELDYASMQLRLLYEQKGLSLPEMEDLYVSPDFEARFESCLEGHRSEMKDVLVKSVGTATREEALKALIEGYRKQNLQNRPERAERIYDAFWSLHAAVCPHQDGQEYKAWKDLQYTDSQIALKVLSKLLDQKITAIPIHDSFIVQARHEDALRSAMLEAFNEVLPGVECVVKKAN